MYELDVLNIQVPTAIIHNWGWFLLFGIGLVALGVAAVVRSVTATVVSMLFFGPAHPPFGMAHAIRLRRRPTRILPWPWRRLLFSASYSDWQSSENLAHSL